MKKRLKRWKLKGEVFKELIKETVNQGRVRWQRHAFERMMERDIYRNAVRKVLLDDELIEKYPEDHPFRSGLFLGFINKEPLHVVAAVDSES